MLLDPTCTWEAHMAHAGTKMVAFAFAAAVTRVDFVIAGGVGLAHGIAMLVLSKSANFCATKIGLSADRIEKLNQALNLISIATTFVALAAIGMMTIELSLALLIILGANYYSYQNHNHPVAPAPVIYAEGR